VPSAHMFAFYFAILSAITPPVALAVFAAAGLAKANIWQAGFTAMRVAAPAYIVPFMFVYEPQLLLIVDGGLMGWLSALFSLCTAMVGVVLLASSLSGWFFGLVGMAERVVLFVAALALIEPGLYSDLFGAAVIGGLLVMQTLRKRKAA